MRKERITFLCLFVVLILISTSCHPRHVSDIRPNMTKKEVVSSWGRTDLISYKTTNGITLETWEYRFVSSGSICRITFIQDRVTANPQCDRPQVGGWYYSQSEQTGPRTNEPSLVREGFFAVKLAEALKIGPVKSEAEAENRLALVGILPKKGWIADYPVTPEIIEELQNAIVAAADSGKIAMNKSEAIKVFEDLVTEIESQDVRLEPSPGRQPYPETYYYPYPYPFYYRFLYPYPYNYPYPYYYGGYYRYYRPYPYPYRYPYYRYRR
jgi:hypothetical protein